MSAYTDEQRARAWDEGYTAGREDADWEDEQGGIRLPNNPYRREPIVEDHQCIFDGAHAPHDWVSTTGSLVHCDGSGVMECSSTTHGPIVVYCQLGPNHADQHANGNLRWSDEDPGTILTRAQPPAFLPDPSAPARRKDGAPS